jgi:hypothetical protein
MCQMSIILKEAGRETVVLESASLLEVIDGGIRVSALFEHPKVVPHAAINEIDFLHGRVILTRTPEEKPAMDPKTAKEKLQVLLPHWIEHNRNHEAEFRKWSAATTADGAAGLSGLLDEAAANMVATDAILKKALAEAGGPAHDHAHPHSHTHHHH